MRPPFRTRWRAATLAAMLLLVPVLTLPAVAQETAGSPRVRPASRTTTIAPDEARSDTPAASRPTGASVFPLRAGIDVARFHVTDPRAGYFDVAARRNALRGATNPVLLDEIAKWRFGVSCRDVMALPMPDKKFSVPGFYVDNAGWREVAQLFLRFESAMSDLAAAQLVADDLYHAECLIDVLTKWARAGALEDYVYTPKTPQAWYTVESSMFSAALALSTVRDLVPERAADLAVIDAWMLRFARRHSDITGLPSTACCNNHFYRRGIYATIIGIMNNDDTLFQYGARAYLTGLELAPDDGWLKLEMIRGRRAAHYQNFATMYLVFLAELLSRQGYDAYAMTASDGRQLPDIIARTLDALNDPTLVEQHGGSADQITPFRTDGQFLTWLEPYAKRFRDPRAEAILARRRPLYNRSLGGAATLIFMPPR
jgi:poly(beta-D-mannuronate) lyase